MFELYCQIWLQVLFYVCMSEMLKTHLLLSTILTN